MTPSEREILDLQIYLETKKAEYRGCITDAADFLRLRDPSRISRLLNPNDSRANNIFGEMLDVLQGLNHKHPKLARGIWERITLAKNSFMNDGSDETELDELAEIADGTVREQLDVNLAISSRKSAAEIEREAFQAFEQSRIQYEKVKAFRNKTQIDLEK